MLILLLLLATLALLCRRATREGFAFRAPLHVYLVHHSRQAPFDHVQQLVQAALQPYAASATALQFTAVDADHEPLPGLIQQQQAIVRNNPVVLFVEYGGALYQFRKTFVSSDISAFLAGFAS